VHVVIVRLADACCCEQGLQRLALPFTAHCPCAHGKQTLCSLVLEKVLTAHGWQELTCVGRKEPGPHVSASHGAIQTVPAAHAAQAVALVLVE
jgi:hypothetical protein